MSLVVNIPVTVLMLVDAEDAARHNQAVAELGADGVTRARGVRNLRFTRERLYALVDAATPEVLAAYGLYRLARAGR